MSGRCRSAVSTIHNSSFITHNCAPPAPAVGPARAGAWTYLGLTFSVLLTSGFFIVSKVAVQAASPLGVATARFGLAALGYVLTLALASPRDLRITRADLPLSLWMGGVGAFGYNLAAFYGLRFAPASDAGVISPMTLPLFMAAIAVLWLGEPFGRRRVVGLVVALGGLLLVVGEGLLEMLQGGQRLWGDLLLVLGGLCWAISSTLGKVAMRRRSAYVVSAHMSFVGAPTLLALALPQGFLREAAHAGSAFWIQAFYLGPIATCLAFWLWYRGIKSIGVARAGVFSNLIPVSALAMAALFLVEPIFPAQALGAAIALVGVCLVNRPL